MRTLSPAAKRARVAAALEQRRAIWSKQELLRELFNLAVLELARRVYPKRKVGDPSKALELVKDRADFAELRDRTVAQVVALDEERDRLRVEIDEHAPGAELRSMTGRWLAAGVVRSGDFSTQGFGATRYAEGTAELRAIAARPYCEAAVWRESERIDYGATPSCFRGESHSTTFVVCVRVDEDVDLEVLKHRPAPTLREQVKWCWANGVNPRVYLPFLPPGYEERTSIDYQGRDIA